jgi:hypothetical protein
VAAWPLNPSDAGLFVGLWLVSAAMIALSAVALTRNRPFLLGVCFFLSLLGIFPGLWGVGFLFYCIAITFGSSTDHATVFQWFCAAMLPLLLVLPIHWASLWRDYRHDIALNI